MAKRWRHSSDQIIRSSLACQLIFDLWMSRRWPAVWSESHGYFSTAPTTALAVTVRSLAIVSGPRAQQRRCEELSEKHCLKP